MRGKVVSYFLDDRTRVYWVYLLKEKFETTNVFQTFHRMIQNQFQAKLLVFRTNNGGDIFASTLGNRIVHQTSYVDTPQQNGIAKRRNKHLLDIAWALSFTMGVPKYLWGEAIQTVCYLVNRMPTKVLNFKTPLDSLNLIFPTSCLFNTLPLRVFGCTKFVNVHKHDRSKLDPRLLKCLIFGILLLKKGVNVFIL